MAKTIRDYIPEDYVGRVFLLIDKNDVTLVAALEVYATEDVEQFVATVQAIARDWSENVCIPDVVSTLPYSTQVEFLVPLSIYIGRAVSTTIMVNAAEMFPDAPTIPMSVWLKEDLED